MGIFVWGTGCGASELLERGLQLEQVSGAVAELGVYRGFSLPDYQIYIE